MRVRRAFRDFTVLGLDLSLRGAGAAVIPKGWDFKFSSVKVMHTGGELTKAATEVQQVERMDRIAHELWMFAEENAAEQVVFFENYAYGAGNQSNHMLLAELVGTVRHKWLEFTAHNPPRSVPKPIPQATARKTVLGKLPRGKGTIKPAVRARLLEWGMPDRWTDDEMDAFVVANEGRFRVGLTGLGVPAEK